MARDTSSSSTNIHVAPADVRIESVLFDHPGDDDREDFVCVKIKFGKIKLDLFFNDYRDADEDLVTGLQQANDFAAAINAALLKAANDPNGGRS